MKYNIISPAEVVAYAFSDGDYLAPDSITAMDIDMAIERWVEPVVGEPLLQAVAQGRYGEMRERYLLPAVATATRLMVQPRLNASTSQLGLVTVAGGNRKSADEALRREHTRAVRVLARTALSALSDYLELHASQFREYDASHNILNRCSCDGGFVQIF